jgi:hypothetical protein
MAVSRECFVLLGGGPCVELISRPEMSCRVWCVLSVVVTPWQWGGPGPLWVLRHGGGGMYPQLSSIQVRWIWSCFCLRYKGWNVSGGITARLFHRDSRLRWLIRFTSRPLYLRGRRPLSSLKRGLDSHKTRCGRFVEKRISYPCRNRTAIPRLFTYYTDRALPNPPSVLDRILLDDRWHMILTYTYHRLWH